MYLRRFEIKNVRSISHFEMSFDRSNEAGWHVVLGHNGAGKSSVVRSLAILLMGEKEAPAAGQIFADWIRINESLAEISASLVWHQDVDRLSEGGAPLKRPIELNLSIEKEQDEQSGMLPTSTVKFYGERHQRSVWGEGKGWFSASFGPFRRFTGGDPLYERSYFSNPRLAPHLSSLTESVALTEARRWLTDLQKQKLQDAANGVQGLASEIIDAVTGFLNTSQPFPHGARIHRVDVNNVLMVDGNQNIIPMDAMSDGFRSVLSMSLELLRLMFSIYGPDTMLKLLREEPGRVTAPGVVAIDEVDAHLHPTWQRDIGRWLTRAFPRLQFIVTTHSPIVCRAVADDEGKVTGSVWLLPQPGSQGPLRRVLGSDLQKLVFGNILDAYDTQLFGKDLVRSASGASKLTKLAAINQLELERELTKEERDEQLELRNAFPGKALILPEEIDT